MIGDGCSSSSTSSASDECHEFPFGDDQLDDEPHQLVDNSAIAEDDGMGLSSSTAPSLSFLNMSEFENESPGAGNLQLKNNEENTDAVGKTDGDVGESKMCWDAHLPKQSTSQEVTTTSSIPVIIPHRGSLRRILNPSSFASLLDANSDQSSNSRLVPNTDWPIYIINVASEDHQHYDQCYQVIFDRQQYEFCTRLFAVLDTESESFVRPECIREFVSVHCPVMRRRDNAIFALRNSNGKKQEIDSESPTFDEIWGRTIHSDPVLACTDGATYRVGIEGWMIFCRILALAQHQETKRRFASRHLQQMMKHKHGGGATTSRPNEVVVVVDNPPPGPPSLISICGLMEVEKERMSSDTGPYIQGWPFLPLALPEFDLNHYLGNDQQLIGMQREPRGRVSIEQFSSAKDGDFVLRLHKNGSTTVVRRSYSDFQWLNEILEFHKRPGQGHLCGRILPPLQSEQGVFAQHQSSTPSGVTQPKDISERAIGAAKSGIIFISSITKSLLSGFVTPSTPSSSPQSSHSRNAVGQVGKMLSSSGPLADASQRIERYLNYLLENDAFSTSFPLNAVLKASQSGLESAKQILRDHSKHTMRQRSELSAAMGRERSHSASSIFYALIYKTSSSILRIQGDDDTRWLRAAAQVAMALQFHGILETTGHESASAKIQHASLPKFGHQRAESWDDEETFNDRQQFSDCNSPGNETNFEMGVVNVDSELGGEEQDLGGYDMLPSPGPSEENRVLNAGVSSDRVLSKSTSTTFVYEAKPEQSNGKHDKKVALVGSVKVECDIDKLHDIILSTKNTLGKLHQSSMSMQSAQAAKNALQLGILRDVDSWADNDSEVITQRALVSGVAALELCNSDTNDINKLFTDDLFWQSLLAASAVGAVSEVRDMVRNSRTAYRAKSAAFAAAEKYKRTYEACDRSLPMEKIRRAQLDASTAQSHAIHATVVEYEANVAKKRSAVSFAHDVKSWNKHRKNELLRTCIQAAKSQREACRKAADAWESIRDGLVGFSACNFATDETNQIPTLMDVRLTQIKEQHLIDLDLQRRSKVMDDKEVNRFSDDYEGLPSPYVFDAEEVTHIVPDVDEIVAQSPSFYGAQSEQQTHSDCFTGSFKEGLSPCKSLNESEQSDIQDVYCLSPTQFSHLNENYFSFHQEILARYDTDSDDAESEAGQNLSSELTTFPSHHDFTSLPTPKDPMSTSMESLIDGLLTAWGDDDEKEENGVDHASTDEVVCSDRDEDDDEK